MSDDETADELRPQDHAKEARGRTAEAAGLAEHIRETDPRWTREQQLRLLITIVDQAHEHAARAEAQLEGDEI